MNQKTLISLGAALAIAIGAYLTLKRPEKGARLGPRPRPVAAFKAAQVKELELSTAGKDKVVLKSEGDTWKVTAPGNWRADQSTVKNAVEQLERLSFGDMVTENPAKHAEFEVSDDKGSHVVVKDAGGKVLLDGWLGKSVAGYTSFRPAGKNEVWQATGIFKYAFSRELGSWRDHNIFDFQKDDVSKLAVEAGGQKIALERIPPKEKTEDAKWKVLETSVRVDPIDDATANNMVQSLGTLRAGGFADEAKATEVGLEPAKQRITVTVKGEAKTVRIGDTKGEDSYVQVEGNPQIYLLQKFNLERLAQPPINFRDKTLYKGGEAGLQAVDITYGGESYSAKKEGAGWKLSKGGEVDDGKVRAMLSVFDDLKASGFAPGVTPAQAGLDKPTATVVLHGRDKSATTLKVGKLVDKDGDYYVSRTGIAEVMLLKKFQAERFLKKPSDLAKSTTAAK